MPYKVSNTAALPTTAVGTVLASQANYYFVQLDIEGDGKPFLCLRRALLKKLGQQVLVGDRVEVEELDWQDRRGAIATIHPRRTQLDRPPVANADQILLVFALASPTLDPHQLSRFLVKAESTGLDVILCLNKRDLVSHDVLNHWQARLQSWGYQPTVISVQTDPALPSELLTALSGKTNIVAGPSGVGKSSLIGRLVPDLTLRTGAVSGKLGRGRHTTRHVELFDLPGSGLLADTPGFNQPDLTCTVEQLVACFPEIQARLAQGNCQFNNCLHRDEPGCAVRGDWERYDDYLAMLEDVMAYQQSLDNRPDEEALEKVKVGAAGQVQHEPKLEARKYRRISRRSRHQAMDDLKLDLTDVESFEDLDDDELEDLGF
ncbi:MAG: small ribosomal subunit biogenesis GTPase RsgA [Cyanobacteria bacterium J06632_22]